MSAPRGIDAAIIDLDGTMVDTLGDFVEALGRMLDDLHLPAVDAEAVPVPITGSVRRSEAAGA